MLRSMVCVRVVIRIESFSRPAAHITTRVYRRLCTVHTLTLCRAAFVRRPARANDEARIASPRHSQRLAPRRVMRVRSDEAHGSRAASPLPRQVDAIASTPDDAGPPCRAWLRAESERACAAREGAAASARRQPSEPRPKRARRRAPRPAGAARAAARAPPSSPAQAAAASAPSVPFPPFSLFFPFLSPRPWAPTCAPCRTPWSSSARRRSSARSPRRRRPRPSPCRSPP